MHKLTNKQHHATWQKVIVALFGISLLVLFLGISGIVEHKSPMNMANLGTLTSSFFTYFEYHALIITGALGFTFAVWLSDQH